MLTWVAITVAVVVAQLALGVLVGRMIRGPE